MSRKRKPLIIPRDATHDEKLKKVADAIYTNAEFWIQACIDNEGLLEEFVWRINGRDKILLRPPQR